jgi:hypothetical protein
MSSLLTILAFAPLPPFIFALIIGLPSALLYATQLVIIWVRPENVAFQSSFFQLVAIRTLWVSLRTLKKNYMTKIDHCFEKLNTLRNLPTYIFMLAAFF